MPYDTEISPMFGVTYGICVLTIICTAFTLALTDSLFMGFCTQIIACQKDLQDKLEELSLIFEK